MLLWLTCTHGRVKCLERNLKCYLDQKTSVPSVMFICNSGVPLKLPDDFVAPAGKEVYIDNCILLDFQSVGEKYNHALKLAKRLYPDVTIYTGADDDDIFLPDHLQEGYEGMQIAGLANGKAYKPQKSWFRYRDQQGILQLTKQENTLEPSIFVDIDWVLEHGYAPVSIRYHQQWLDPLMYENKILIDSNGKSTLIYNWGDNSSNPAESWGIYKMSGAGIDNQQNFIAHARSSRDMGDGILRPNADNSEYYKLPQ